jgi:hypothetical protein
MWPVHLSYSSTFKGIFPGERDMHVISSTWSVSLTMWITCEEYGLSFGTTCHHLMERLLALHGAPSSYMEWPLHNTLKCYKVPNRKPNPLKCLHEEGWICDVDDFAFQMCGFRAWCECLFLFELGCLHFPMIVQVCSTNAACGLKVESFVRFYICAQSHHSACIISR